jgi:hypothetical protein
MLKPPGNCWDIRFHHEKMVGGDEQFHFSFNFQFGGA